MLYPPKKNFTKLKVARFFFKNLIPVVTGGHGGLNSPSIFPKERVDDPVLWIAGSGKVELAILQFTHCSFAIW